MAMGVISKHHLHESVWFLSPGIIITVTETYSVLTNTSVRSHLKPGVLRCVCACVPCVCACTVCALESAFWFSLLINSTPLFPTQLIICLQV